MGKCMNEQMPVRSWRGGSACSVGMVSCASGGHVPSCRRNTVLHGEVDMAASQKSCPMLRDYGMRFWGQLAQHLLVPFL